HRADQRQGEIIAQGTGLGIEWGIRRWREDLRLLLRHRLRRLSRLVILVGKVAQSSDGGDAADVRHVAGELAACLRAEQRRRDARRLPRVVPCNVAELAGLAEKVSRLTA